MTSTITTTAVRLVGMSKDYGPVRVLDDVSIDLHAGRVHALLGGNGSGKSTLIKILAGVDPRGSGGIITLGDRECSSADMTPHKAGELGLRFVHQNTAVIPGMTVADNIMLDDRFPTRLGTIDASRTAELATEALKTVGLDLDTRALASTLSPAERTLVAIARALRHRNGLRPALVVLDEPTAALSDREARRLVSAMRDMTAHGTAVLFVSHRLDEVLEVAEDVTVLRDGRMSFQGSREGLTEQDLVRYIVGDTIETTRRSSGYQGTDTVLSLHDLSVGSISSLNLTVGAGEIVGIAGMVGSSRSRLLRTIFGYERPLSGRMTLKGRPFEPRSVAAAVARKVALVPEDRAADAAFLGMSVGDNISVTSLGSFVRRGLLRAKLQKRAALDAVDRYLVKTPSVDSPISSLSGGNQQKVIFGRWLETDPALLLLDEPTQGVDIGARTQMHQMVRIAAGTGLATLVVSSDFTELCDMCDRIIVLRGGSVIAELTPEQFDTHRITELAFSTTKAATS